MVIKEYSETLLDPADERCNSCEDSRRTSLATAVGSEGGDTDLLESEECWKNDETIPAYITSAENRPLLDLRLLQKRGIFAIAAIRLAVELNKVVTERTLLPIASPSKFLSRLLWHPRKEWYYLCLTPHGTRLYLLTMSQKTNDELGKSLVIVELLTKIRLPLLLTTRGPPESPWHVLLPPAPLTQTLEDWTTTLKVAEYWRHTALVITGKLTCLKVWLTWLSENS